MDERDSKTMQEWERERLGTTASELSAHELQEALPRPRDLRQPPFLSRLGGRVRQRLRPWPTSDRAAELSKRAQRFLADTPEKR